MKIAEKLGIVSKDIMLEKGLCKFCNYIIIDEPFLPQCMCA